METESSQSKEFEQMRSVSELSEWFGIPVKTIYKWTSNHHSGIPFYRLGKHLRFRFSEVESWLRKYHGSEGVREFAPIKMTGNANRAISR